MKIAQRGIEKPRNAWGNAQIYWEEYICATCGFRVRQRYLIMDWGEAFK